MGYIPYNRHYIDDRDIKEVSKALRSDWLTQGPKVKEFERDLARYTGAKYAIAVSGGTAALHLAMLALGVGKNDKVITSPITFCASANCALYVGARPLFVDIDDKTYHLDPGKLKDFLKAPSRRKGVKAVIPVHFMGGIADLAEIKKICDKYGIKVVEDAAHALGAAYKFKERWIKIGSSSHSDATMLSFHPIKHITTGEGGAILTSDKKVYETASRLRHHGIVKHRKILWAYDIPQVGFNYRISDFQCALGISQLKRLDEMVRIRRERAKGYNDNLASIKEIRLPYEKEGTRSSYHLYVIRIPRWRRSALYNYLRRYKILTQVNYIPVHLLSYYKERFGYGWGDFPVAERYFRECLSLPLYVGLSLQDQMKVIKLVGRFFGK